MINLLCIVYLVLVYHCSDIFVLGMYTVVAILVQCYLGDC